MFESFMEFTHSFCVVALLCGACRLLKEALRGANVSSRGFAVAALAALGFTVPVAAQAGAALNELAGAWTLVSNGSVSPDGGKTDIFGAEPRGTVIFTSDGRFAAINMRSDLPRFASGNRMQGTPDENKAIVQGSIALFGTYTLDPADNTITLQVQGSTWPSWTGTRIKRLLVFAGDEMKWTLSAASVGGTAEIVWKRPSASTVSTK